MTPNVCCKCLENAINLGPMVNAECVRWLQFEVFNINMVIVYVCNIILRVKKEEFCVWSHRSPCFLIYVALSRVLFFFLYVRGIPIL